MLTHHRPSGTETVSSHITARNLMHWPPSAPRAWPFLSTTYVFPIVPYIAAPLPYRVVFGLRLQPIRRRPSMGAWRAGGRKREDFKVGGQTNERVSSDAMNQPSTPLEFEIYQHV